MRKAKIILLLLVMNNLVTLCDLVEKKNNIVNTKKKGAISDGVAGLNDKRSEVSLNSLTD